MAQKNRQDLELEYQLEVDKLVERSIFPREKRDTILERLFGDGPPNADGKFILPGDGPFYFHGLYGSFRAASLSPQEKEVLEEIRITSGRVTKFLHSEILPKARGLLDVRYYDD